MRSNGLRCAIILFVAICAALPARAAQRFASPNGSGNCSTAGAACDLLIAVSGANADDELILAPGTYTLEGTLQLDVPLTIHGTPGQARPRVVGAAGQVAIETFETLTASDLRIESTDNAVGALFAVGADSLFERLELISVSTGNAQPSALCLRPGTNFTLRDSLLIARGGTDAGAVFIQGTVNGTATLRNVTAIVSGPGSVAIGVTVVAPANVTVNLENVIAAGETDLSASATQGTVAMHVGHSNFDTATGVTAGEGNQTAAPVFVDAAADDYRPALGSATIDAGIPDDANGATDLDGNARALGAAPDIGAFEFVPDTTAPATTIGLIEFVKPGLVTTTLGCPDTEAQCDWSYALASTQKIGKGKKAAILDLGSGAATAPGGGSAAVSITLARPHVKLIKRRKKLEVILTVEATDAVGNSATSSRTETIRARGR